MNILHITDFHFANDNNLQRKVVDSIIKVIRDKEKLKIELILFTGDLVDDGSNYNSFILACQELFTKLSKELKIDKKNIIFCPGNHDIDRTKIHPALFSYFEINIKSDDDLNKLYKNKNNSIYIDSIKPSSNYLNFLKDYHEQNEKNIINDLYSIHFREIHEKKIAIVCLNSAWLSKLDTTNKQYKDKENLVIPNALLKEIKDKIENSTLKIILVHHPLYFLKEYNFNGIENPIHNGFDLLFSGHVHKISSVASHNGSNGIFEHVAKAALSRDSLGCSIIDLDEIGNNQILVKEITYVIDSDDCFIAEPIIHTIPHGIEKDKAISFRKKIYEKIALEKESANKLLLLKEEDKIDFMAIYNRPILKKEVEGGLSVNCNEIYSLDSILKFENNYLILGKDKCGKTSLLKKIQIDCLINFSRNGKIPFFADARELENKIDDKFEIDQLIRNYFSISNRKLEEILSSGNFVLLIDNYSQNTGFSVYLNLFFKKHSELKYIICSEYNISNTVELFDFGNTLYEKLYFHDLRRQEIIAYTNERLVFAQNKDEIQDKIIKLCRQLELPLNYWTVSLLLLIYNKSSDSHFKNLFSVLDVCIDNIFNKKAMIIANGRISFDQLKTVCSELAKFLLSKEKSIYSETSQNIIEFIDSHINQNERISTNGRAVFEYLVNCGILKKKDENEFYVFRLNGFFEYFLALQMTKDKIFKADILLDEKKYLAFKNQIEIYTGYKRDDIEFLNTIFEKSTKKLDPIFKIYSANKDNELIGKINEPQIIENICRNIPITRALSSSQKASFEDQNDEITINSDVHLISYINPEKINSELIERYISILARSFRNSDEIKGENNVTLIFNKILDYYCDMSFFIIDEFSSLTKAEIKDLNFEIDDFPELNLLKFISNFIPLISQSSLSDGLGHFNLERIIIKKIENLEADYNNNQYKLFLLYFLLLDIDLKSNLKYINRSLENIKLPILRYATLIKLNFYLAFKSSNDKRLQAELSTFIQRIKLTLDYDKNDLGSIQKDIQMKKRISRNILK